DAGAKLDAGSFSRQIGEGCHGVRTIRLGSPEGVVAELFSLKHAVKRQFHPSAGIANTDAELHTTSLSSLSRQPDCSEQWYSWRTDASIRVFLIIPHFYVGPQPRPPKDDSVGRSYWFSVSATLR